MKVGSSVLICVMLLTAMWLSSASKEEEEEDEEEDEKEEVLEAKYRRRNETFIEPKELSDLEDLFTLGDKEYVFVNFAVNHLQAGIMCTAVYNGHLAAVPTVDLAEFLAEALSETNLIMDTLWTAGQRINDTWFWYDESFATKPIDGQIIALFVNYSKMVDATDRDCLSISREDHDVPHFPALTCNALRPYICERPVSPSNNGSTHPGWIVLGQRRYKIFQERVSWEEAMAKCVINDRKSNLAVLIDFKDSQELSRYLLIGRPSLENAWIGAWYHNYNYRFLSENIVLSNLTNTEGYPPWRNGAVKKRDGCLLLDRHISNQTLFIEARCDRKRPYICYIREPEKKDLFMDIFIEEFGYRVYFTEVVWDSARDKCNTFKRRYHAKLAEIRERRIIAHMLYAMGENKTAIQHIWLGGVYDFAIDRWVWDSDKSLVNRRHLNWLKNTTYFRKVEQYNTCLNMDRENAIKAMHYGTLCDYKQYFVCMFPRSGLEQLERDEVNKTVRRHIRRRKVIRYG